MQSGGQVFRGTIHTMESPDSQTDAMAVRGGTIVAIGAEATALAERGWPVTDLQDGQVMVPGFVDAHTHFLHVGVKRLRPDLRGAESLAQAMEWLQRWLAGNEPGQRVVPNPGDDVIAEGWDESFWPEKRGPTQAELDALWDGPLVCRRIDGHYAVGNKLACEKVIKVFPTRVKDGVLLEEASLYLNEVMPVSPEHLDLAVQLACEVAHERGATAVGDYSQAPFREAYLRSKTLNVRVASCIYVQQLDDAIAAGFHTGRTYDAGEPPHASNAHANRETAGLPSQAADVQPQTHPWIADAGLKVFLDGSLGGYTALLHEPYEGTDNCGDAIWTPEEITNWFTRAHDNGVQIHAHAIGDKAIDLALDGFQALHQRPNGATGSAVGCTVDGVELRHRIEHYELPTDEAVQRTVDLNVVASCQPNFVGEWSSKGGMYENRLGTRYMRNNCYRTWKAAGMEVAFGSDGMPFGPLVGLQAAVNHPVEAERMSKLEAIWHYTNRAAWSLHQEWGVLAPGRVADFLIVENLEADPIDWRLATYTAGILRCSGLHAAPQTPN